jgi:hypothetical protein
MNNLDPNFQPKKSGVIDSIILIVGNEQTVLSFRSFEMLFRDSNFVKDKTKFKKKMLYKKITDFTAPLVLRIDLPQPWPGIILGTIKVFKIVINLGMNHLEKRKINSYITYHINLKR